MGSILDIIMYACAAVGAIVICVLGILLLMFPKEMKAIGTLANDAMNIGFAKQGVDDIAAAIGGPAGTIVSGVLLGLMGVWVLLKTGSLQKVNEVGKGLSGLPSMVTRAVAMLLFPAVIVGVLAVGLAKLDLSWTIEALKAYFNFTSNGQLFKGSDAGKVKFL
jgi:hypothetical protein